MRIIFPLLAAAVALPLSQAQLIINSRPARVLGHAQRTLVTTAPNLVEGRELNSPQGIAIDTSATPPILYVSDTGNNRVLAWRDATSFASGAFADSVIGQRDLCSTLAHVDGDPDLPIGLTAPTGLAVDASGQLYVADSGNNRILRFPRPSFTPASGPCRTRDDPAQPNFVIGQTSFNTRTAATSQTKIYTNTGGGPMVTALAFDSSGNLFFTDAANHRVLRYPAASLADGQPNGPAADMVLGQTDFLSAKTVSTTDPSKPDFYAGMNQPAGLAFDPAGRLFVSDAISRVLLFDPGFASAGKAARYMGARPTDTAGVSAYALSAPQALFTIGSIPFVVDTYANRILRYDACPWAGTQLETPAANAVAGQDDFTSAKANRGLPVSRGDTLNSPVQAAFLAATKELFVADAGNSRVLVFPYDPAAPPAALNGLAATRVLGQTSIYCSSPNLIEGREFRFSYSVVQGGSVTTVGQAGIAIDNTSQPARLYISDPGNNRILGFRDARKVKPGDVADIIIGQPADVLFGQLSARNWPTNDPLQPTQVGLSRPAGLAVDAAGNLYVADTGNGRVLRFPKPFDAAATTDCLNGHCRAADLVLGQSTFTATNTGVATSRLMASPYGVAISKDGHLLVSDINHNRVLLFLKPDGGDFANGMAAASVFGQPDLASSSVGTSDNRLSGPRLIALDADDRLYVADTGNSRVLIFNSILGNRTPSDPAAVARVRGLYNPFAVSVNKASGEVWITDTQNRRTVRYPSFDAISACSAQDTCANSDVVPAAADQASAYYPLAVAQDAGGALYVADLAHRITMYYPAVVAFNTASGKLTQTSGFDCQRILNAECKDRLAPGAIASVFVQQKLVDSNQAAGAMPLPKTLADYQVLARWTSADGAIHESAAPVFAIASVPYSWQTQVNFMIPAAAPSTGQAEFVITRASTGEVLGFGPFAMDVASPALFAMNQQGSGQAAAVNQVLPASYSVNSATNPVPRTQYILLYGTGQGALTGAPADGESSSGLVWTGGEIPKVYIGTKFVDPSDVVYSGLAPGFAGLWQINVRVPDWVGAVNSQPVFVQYKGITTNVVTIAVK